MTKRLTRCTPILLKHPFKAAEDKPLRARGAYLNPEVVDKAEERRTAVGTRSKGRSENR